MSGLGGEPSDMPSEIPVSPGSVAGPSETRTGPGIGGVPPIEDMAPGWGLIEDGGGAPSILEVEEAPEGSMRATAPTLRFYDIKMFEHRIWQAIPHPDRPIAEGDTCSFPDYLVFAVERERDYLLNERVGLRAQVEILQRELERARAEAMLVRTEADSARLEAHRSVTEVSNMRDRLGGFRDDLEFVEEQYREALLETGELKTQICSRDVTIADLRQQIQTRDSRIARGMGYLRRSYQELESGVYVPEAPIRPPSDSSVTKRPHYCEPLEGSSEGPTDSDPDDDEPGGATSGGSAGTPIVEPGEN